MTPQDYDTIAAVLHNHGISPYSRTPVLIYPPDLLDALAGCFEQDNPDLRPLQLPGARARHQGGMRMTQADADTLNQWLAMLTHEEWGLFWRWITTAYLEAIKP